MYPSQPLEEEWGRQEGVEEFGSSSWTVCTVRPRAAAVYGDKSS